MASNKVPAKEQPPTHPTARLRFIERDGRVILQQLDGLAGWGDVPLVQVAGSPARPPLSLKRVDPRTLPKGFQAPKLPPAADESEDSSRATGDADPESGA